MAIDVTTAPSPVTHVHDTNAGHAHHDGLSGKDAAFLSEGRIQTRAVEDARGLGRIDRDLANDVKGNMIAVKDANLFTVDRIHESERRILERNHEIRELVRIDGEKTRELLHQQKTEALARELQDVKVEQRFSALHAIVLRLLPAGTAI